MVTKAQSRGILPDTSQSARYGELIDSFHQVQYRRGMTLEAAMCKGVFPRIEGAVLCLATAEVGGGVQVLRNDIERSLRDCYDASNCKASTVPGDLASSLLSLFWQAEGTHSGREKIVTLTPAGLALVDGIRKRGKAYFENALFIKSITPTPLRNGARRGAR